MHGRSGEIGEIEGVMQSRKWGRSNEIDGGGGGDGFGVVMGRWVAKGGRISGVRKDDWGWILGG